MSISSRQTFTTLFVSMALCSSMLLLGPSVNIGSSGGAYALDSEDGLVRSGNLSYQGAFRLPDPAGQTSTFAWGGTAPAYNPLNDSLFLVGHDYDQQVAELEIPNVVNAGSLDELETAQLMQPFADLSEGGMYPVGGGEDDFKIGGLYVRGGSLFGTAYQYYDAAGSQINSHFVSSTDLSLQGDARGLFQVGDKGAGSVAGYMIDIPSAWQNVFDGPTLTGLCCIPIISRSSYGPAAFVIDPADIAQGPVSATPLIHYPEANPLAGWDETNGFFNGTTSVRGAVFPEGSSSILFFGTHGHGEFCYGTGEACGDPVSPYQGTHAYPYRFQVWAYDARDLLRVKNQQLQPWQVRPYSVWNFDLPFGGDVNAIGGAAYDPATQRIFLSQMFGDGDMPVIHVYEVNSSGSGPGPPGDSEDPGELPPDPTEQPKPPDRPKQPQIPKDPSAYKNACKLKVTSPMLKLKKKSLRASSKAARQLFTRGAKGQITWGKDSSGKKVVCSSVKMALLQKKTGRYFIPGTEMQISSKDLTSSTFERALNKLNKSKAGTLRSRQYKSEKTKFSYKPFNRSSKLGRTALKNLRRSSYKGRYTLFYKATVEGTDLFREVEVRAR